MNPQKFEEFVQEVCELRPRAGYYLRLGKIKPTENSHEDTFRMRPKIKLATCDICGEQRPEGRINIEFRSNRWILKCDQKPEICLKKYPRRLVIYK